METNVFQCRQVIREATNFTGADVNSLAFSSEMFIMSSNGPFQLQDPRLGHLRQLFREIKLSCNSLKSLDLELDIKTTPLGFVDLVFSCPQLLALKLAVISDLGNDRNQENFELGFPEHPCSSKLVTLELEFDQGELDWESRSPLAWIGTRLTSFNLSHGKEGEQSTIPITSLPSILDSNPSLETIKFQHLSVTESESSSPTPTKLFLPNLNSIQPHSVHLLVTICSK